MQLTLSLSPFDGCLTAAGFWVELGAWPEREEGGACCCCWPPPTTGLDNEVGRWANEPPGVGGACKMGD